MKVILEIDCDGDAFQGNLDDEVARMLTSFAKAVLVDGIDDMVGHDTNGNRCATMRIVE